MIPLGRAKAIAAATQPPAAKQQPAKQAAAPESALETAISIGLDLLKSPAVRAALRIVAIGLAPLGLL